MRLLGVLGCKRVFLFVLAICLLLAIPSSNPSWNSSWISDTTRSQFKRFDRASSNWISGTAPSQVQRFDRVSSPAPAHGNATEFTSKTHVASGPQGTVHSTASQEAPPKIEKKSKRSREVIAEEVTVEKGSVATTPREEKYVVDFASPRRGCPVCLSNESCAKCVTSDGETGSFSLERVLYRNGDPKLFIASPDTSKAFKACYTHCDGRGNGRRGPSYGTFAQYGAYEEKAVNGMGQVPDRMQGDCPKFDKIAVVVTDHSMFNYYHYLMDRAYELFVFIGAVAHSNGCPTTKIEVFLVTMVYKPMVPVWESLWRRKSYKQMNGCYKAVYYGAPWTGARVCNTGGGNRPEFEFNKMRSYWASLFGMKLRDAWKVSHDYKQHSRMLILHHSRMPNWMWLMNWSFDNVTHIPGDFSSKSIADQVKIMGAVRGIITVTGAGMANQLFLSPRSAIFQLGPNMIAQNRASNNRLIFTEWCDTVPQGVQDTWAMHLGHTMLTWRWCHPWAFHRNKTALRDIGTSAIKWLLEENVKARKERYAWSCYILKSDIVKTMKFYDRNVSLNTCDKVIIIKDNDMDSYRDSRETFKKRSCGSFGPMGPSMLGGVAGRTFTCVVPTVKVAGSCKPRVILK